MNDNRPLFTNPSIVELITYDNWLPGIELMQFEAKDKDSDKNGLVIYGLEDLERENNQCIFIKFKKNKNLDFQIDPEAGLLVVAQPLFGLSRDKPYSFLVTATDNGTPKFSSTTRLLII